LTNIEAKITNQSHTSNKLTLTIDSVLGTNSPTLIYVGDMGRPANVSGATTWSYNSEKKIASINVNTGRREVTLYWMITTISVSSGAQGSNGWFTSNENTPITFDGSSSSDNIGVVTCTWDFGDGTTGTSKTATHTYAKSGNYTVTLTVRDTANNTAVDFITLEVLPPEPFPMWIAAATIVAIIGIAITIALFRRRRRPPASP
jgi:PKD repeat protein